MRKLAAIGAFVLAAMVATPADALRDTKNDPTHPNYYLNKPTNRPKQNIGRTVQEACKRGGRVGPAGCLSAGAAAGGVGLGLSATGSVPAGTTEAAAGFATGCAIGGLAGAGVFSLPGCMIGGALLGLAGYLTADTCVDQECRIKANPDGLIPGQATKQPLPAGSGVARCEVSYDRISILPGYTPASLKQGGTLCRTRQNDGSYTYRQLARVPMTFNVGQRTADIGAGPVSYNGGGGGGVTHLMFNSANMSLSFIPYSGGGNVVREFYTADNQYAGRFCMADEFCPPYESYYATPDVREGALYFFVGETYGTPQEVPVIEIQKGNPVPLYAIGWGTTIKETDLDKPLHDKLVAALAQRAWQQAGAAAGEGAYVQTDFVTDADVQASYRDNPAERLTVRDLLRPIADPSAPGGTTAQPVPEPTQTVPVTSPGGTTGTGQTGPTTTKEAADTDLDNEELSGVLGDPLQPIKSFIAGPLAPYLSASFNVPQGTCPAIDWDMEPWFGWFFTHSPNGGTQGTVPAWLRIQTSLHCQKMEEWRSWIQGFLGILLTISSFRWFFSRGDD